MFALKQVRRTAHPWSWGGLPGTAEIWEAESPSFNFESCFSLKSPPAETSLHGQQFVHVCPFIFFHSMVGWWSMVKPHDSKCYHTGWDFYFDALCGREGIQQLLTRNRISMDQLVYLCANWVNILKLTWLTWHLWWHRTFGWWATFACEICETL